MDNKIFETVKNEGINSTYNKLIKKDGIDSVKLVSKYNRNVDVGLQIPGSNWERYRSIIDSETVSTNQTNIRKNKKKKRNKCKVKNDNPKLQSNEISECKIRENKNEVEGYNGLTKVIAIDCEMVGIRDGQASMIARVSIVNQYGVCIYDKYVKPTEKVINYRTAVSGIRPHNLKNGEDFEVVQKEVSDIFKGRILVGHALYNDLRVLFLSHPKKFIRDTSRYFRQFFKGQIPSLKLLASELLDLDIQSGEHDSVEDARTTMEVYKLFKNQWENEIQQKYYKKIF